MEPEVRQRALAGMRAFHSLAPHLKSTRVSRNTKARLYKSIVRPAAIYGAETWTLSRETEARMAVMENNALR